MARDFRMRDGSFSQVFGNEDLLLVFKEFRRKVSGFMTCPVLEGQPL